MRCGPTTSRRPTTLGRRRPTSSWEAPPADDGWMPGAPAAASAPPIVPQAATPARYAAPAEALHTVFGYEAFRGNQAAAIDQRRRGRRRGRAHAHRWRQEPDLPDPGARATGHGSRRQPAHRAHARPGRRARRQRRARRVPQLHAGRSAARGRRARVPRRRARSHLRRSRAAVQRVDAIAPAARHPQRHRDRRGALRVAMGSRLPPRLPHCWANWASSSRACLASR